MSKFGASCMSPEPPAPAADPRVRQTATWIALDLGPLLEVVEFERRVLATLDDLSTPVGYVVTHDFAGVVPRASAAIRSQDAEREASTLAKELHARLGGTAVVLAPSMQQRVAVVLGHPGAAWDCLRAAMMSRDGLAGRCLRFPGHQRLTGRVSVRRILERSAITRVIGTSREVSPEDVVDLRGPLRPAFDGGHLVLRVTTDEHGALVCDTRPAGSGCPGSPAIPDHRHQQYV